MQLYLIQHGDAKPEEEDPERPLSETGIQETEGIAAKLKELGTTPTKIFHSTKLRARQTAELFASALQAETEEIEGLKPMDEPSIVKEKLHGLEEAGSYMFVGHLPHMEKLAALLLTGSQDPPVHLSRYSSPLCLEQKEGSWRVKFYLLPELL
ncbi:phosphohistidine phosphatase SixA [Candidatus Micrarchaeota archaeon]|nr:phosphohistidine phosphatase SixA [Candidatus Micrarchaeota archaeon]MBD3417853.1 phosphohistidine phosphatase SixA [Candidatus Micrarchaeota archaeon]